jgi:hypothetical protein
MEAGRAKDTVKPTSSTLHFSEARVYTSNERVKRLIFLLALQLVSDLRFAAARKACPLQINSSEILALDVCCPSFLEQAGDFIVAVSMSLTCIRILHIVPCP